MHEKVSKFFHTDKWWGKTIFIIVVYKLFWWIFYGSWLLMPRAWFLEYNNSNQNILGWLLFSFLFILVPILSFFIPKFIQKVFIINKTFLYCLHIFLLILSIVSFFTWGAWLALSHIQIG